MNGERPHVEGAGNTIEVRCSDGTRLRGVWSRPDDEQTCPVVVDSHGFGDSDGRPRQEIGPFVQISERGVVEVSDGVG